MWRRLRALLHPVLRRGSARDIDDEIEGYVVDLTAKHRKAGLSDEEARRAALIEAGGIEQARDAARSVQPWFGITTFGRDMRYAIRSLRRAPAFTLTVTITLIVGVSTATAIVSVAHHVLLRPLPFPDPDRIVAFEPGAIPVAFSAGTVSPEAQALTEFSALGFYTPGGINLSEADGPQRVNAAAATSGFLDVLGVPVLHGRPFTADDDRRAHVAILGYAFWQRAFGGDGTVIGRSISLNDQSFQVVGVMPPGFSFPVGVDVWVPPFSDTQMAGQAIVPWVIGRLAPGVSAASALQAVRGLRPASTEEDGEPTPVMSTLQERLTREARPTLLLLTSTVSILLIGTIVNVCGLVVLRLRNRERELLVRLALGASTGRVVRQVLVEMALVGVVSGGLGVLVAHAGISAFRATNADLAVTDWPATATWGLAAVGGGIALVVLCLVALGVTLIVARTTPAAIVRAPTASSRRPTSANAAFVVTQIALAVVILAASSTAVVTNRLSRIELGYDDARAIAFEVTLPRSRYPGPRSVATFTDTVLDHLQTLPGVTAAGATNHAPGGTAVMLGTTVALSDVDASFPGANTAAAGEETGGRTGIALSATPDYFRVLGIRLIAGRYFDRTDTAESAPVAVLTLSAARMLADDPVMLIGRRLVGSRAMGGEREKSSAWSLTSGCVLLRTRPARLRPVQSESATRHGRLRRR